MVWVHKQLSLMFNIYVTDINYDDVNGTAQTWVISFNIN